jgi:hypothetical protein
MARFLRESLPNPQVYYEGQGLTLIGKGPWRTTRCDYHGGSDSLRINIESGAFVCMAGCGARGGDVLAFHRAAHGLGFVEAAQALGAWEDVGGPISGNPRPAHIPARELLQLASDELTVCMLVLHDALNGGIAQPDLERFIAAAGRVKYVAEVAHA